MIQDIYPHKLDNHYDTEKIATPESLVLHFRGKEVLLNLDGDKPGAPMLKDLPDVHEVVYLLTIDDRDLYLALQDDVTVPEGYEYISVDEMRRKKIGEQYQIFTAITAYQLSNWYHNNKYCGRCGKPMMLAKSERAIKCPACNNRVYPKLVPAVIVGVLNGDKILLTKYNTARNIPYYALIAGFTEIGETLEECVQREVMEEVGLKVKNIRYYKSQPWGIVDDILMGFYCDLDGDPTIHLDTSELKVGVWATADEVILQPDDYSLTNEMMTRFKNGEKC